MTDHDLKKIEEMFQKNVGEVSIIFQHKLDIVAENQLTLSKKIEQFKKEIKGELQRQLAIQSVRIHRTLDFLIAGNQVLSDKLDRFELRLNQRADHLENTLCAIITKHKEHRIATETNGRYR